MLKTFLRWKTYSHNLPGYLRLLSLMLNKKLYLFIFRLGLCGASGIQVLVNELYEIDESFSLLNNNKFLMSIINLRFCRVSVIQVRLTINIVNYYKRII